jgi:ABC-type antimicrobial peptide transport system permease subunit
VAALDPDLPVYFLRTVEEWVRANSFGSFLVARLFTIFGAVGFALAGVGLYAVLAYGVAQRQREIGVRRALGALDRGIVRLVMRQSATQSLIGLALGLPLAVLFGQALSGELVGVDAFDPVSLAAVVGLIVAVTLLASTLPVRRALRVDPLRALRQE